MYDELLFVGNNPDIAGFFVETDFLVLLLFAIVSHHVVEKLFTRCEWQPAAKFLVVPFAILFGGKLLSENSFQEDVSVTVAILSRWLIGCWIVLNCAATPVIFVAHLLTRYCQREWDRIEHYVHGLVVWHQEKTRKQPQPQLESTPVLPRETVLLRNAEKARLDFEFECKIIEDAGLAAEESEAAIDQAKQKYLRRLNEELQ